MADIKSARVLEPHLHAVHKDIISIKDKEWKENKAYLKKVFEQLIEMMKKCDEVFAELYRQPSFQGSTYENMKIVIPNEFDINVELGLADFYYITIDVNRTMPGFARIRLKPKENVRNSRVLAKVSRWCYNGYLLTTELKDWLKGVVDKAISRLNPNVIRRSDCGPGLTLKNELLDIDLVPALPFRTKDLPNKQKAILKDFRRPVDVEKFGWFLIPKMPKHMDSSKGLEDQWRMSLYLYEREMMRGLSGLKPGIKLLKLYRDRQGFKGLSSYFIKTVYLWEIQERSEGFWINNSQGFIFLEMLRILERQMGQRGREIPFFWDEDHNLVDPLSFAFKQGLQNSLAKFRRQLEDAVRTQDASEATKRVLEKMFKCKLISGQAIPVYDLDESFSELSLTESSLPSESRCQIL